MSGIEVGEVWGVGGRIARRLEAMGIHTVLDLRNASPKEMRRHFGVVMERTCNELRGISCLALRCCRTQTTNHVFAQFWPTC